MPRTGPSPWKPSGFGLLFAGIYPRTTTARISLLLFVVLLAGSSLLLILLGDAYRKQGARWGAP
jgi:hypothetical protein